MATLPQTPAMNELWDKVTTYVTEPAAQKKALATLSTAAGCSVEGIFSLWSEVIAHAMVAEEEARGFFSPSELFESMTQEERDRRYEASKVLGKQYLDLTGRVRAELVALCQCKRAGA